MGYLLNILRDGAAPLAGYRQGKPLARGPLGGVAARAVREPGAAAGAETVAATPAPEPETPAAEPVPVPGTAPGPVKALGPPARTAHTADLPSSASVYTPVPAAADPATQTPGYLAAGGIHVSEPLPPELAPQPALTHPETLLSAPFTTPPVRHASPPPAAISYSAVHGPMPDRVFETPAQPAFSDPPPVPLRGAASFVRGAAEPPAPAGARPGPEPWTIRLPRPRPGGGLSGTAEPRPERAGLEPGGASSLMAASETPRGRLAATPAAAAEPPPGGAQAPMAVPGPPPAGAKLTIHRLEVQVVGPQPLKPLAPEPVSPAPAGDRWEGLDRHYLRRLLAP